MRKLPKAIMATMTATIMAAAMAVSPMASNIASASSSPDPTTMTDDELTDAIHKALNVDKSNIFKKGKIEYSIGSDKKTVSVYSVDKKTKGAVTVPAKVKCKKKNYKVTGIEPYAFALCKKVTSVKMPSAVNCICEGAFYGCESLKSVRMPNKLRFLEEDAFKDCTSLESIVINGYRCLHIESSAFENCTSLKTVTLRDSVTQIKAFAFAGCSSLEKVIVPDSVNTVENFAFDTLFLEHSSTLHIICSDDNITAQYADAYGIPHSEC